MVIAQAFIDIRVTCSDPREIFQEQETVFLEAPIFAGAINTHETYQTLRKGTDLRRQGRV